MAKQKLPEIAPCKCGKPDAMTKAGKVYVACCSNLRCEAGPRVVELTQKAAVELWNEKVRA